LPWTWLSHADVVQRRHIAFPSAWRHRSLDCATALNVAVVEQLHAVRLAFYTALYNRSLESIRTNSGDGCERMLLLRKIVTRPGWRIGARSPAPVSRPLNWIRKLKARIAPIWPRNCNWPKRWRSILRRHRCPSPKVICSLSRCASILTPKQGGPAEKGRSQARAFIRACGQCRSAHYRGRLLSRHSGKHHRQLHPVSGFTAKAQPARHKTFFHPKSLRGLATHGTSSITAR